MMRLRLISQDTAALVKKCGWLKLIALGALLWCLVPIFFLLVLGMWLEGYPKDEADLRVP